jgi:hypothetical protein
MNRALEQKSKSVRLQRVTLNKITTDVKPPKSKRGDTLKRDSSPKRSKPPVWVVAAICAAAVLLIVTVYFLVFSGGKSAASAATATPEMTLAPTPSPTPEPTPEPTPVPTATPEPTPSTMWGQKFPGKFTDGEVLSEDNSYRSEHINVTIQKTQQKGLTYFVADIYITDIEYFRTAFAGNRYGGGGRKYADDMCADFGAVLTMNGDYYTNNKGPVVRNGIVYRKDAYKDILVMYNDGTMETFLKGEYDIDAILAKGVWQMWTFGPQLLNDGQPMTEFNSSVTRANPRAAVGYYEPGHYCFVAVDGRQGSYSRGLDMTQLSQLMYDLGCKVAFNLDGGGSAQLAFKDKLANKPCGNYRQIVDILYITDDPDAAPPMPEPKK